MIEFSLQAKSCFCYGDPEYITILIRGAAVTFSISMNVPYIELLRCIMTIVKNCAIFRRVQKVLLSMGCASVSCSVKQVPIF